MSAVVTEIIAPLTLEAGTHLQEAKLVYAIYGKLNRERTNAIVFPTRFGATHRENEFLIGSGKALDPDRWCVIVPNLFGNGLSSSPSNTPSPIDGPRFPSVTIGDAVRMQHHLVIDVLQIRKIALVVGWSMGAQQAYEWAAQHPELVQRLAVICGAARTSEHNKVFLESLRSAIRSDPTWRDGNYLEPPKAGLRTAGRIYAGWAYSQDWYRERLHLTMGAYATLEDYLSGYWDRLFEQREANNVLSMLATWIAHDISANSRYQGDLIAALRAIEARTLLMPSSTDLYFRTAENMIEREFIRRCLVLEIPTVWGHMCASGQSPADTAFIDNALSQLLHTE